MQFAAPHWLFGLIPWAAVAIYLLIGRRRRVVVPFIDLWPKAISHSNQRCKLRLPPALAAMLAAMALAILAAAGPQVLRSGTDHPVVLIVDRGITMSARSGSQRRFQTIAAGAEVAILNTLGDGRARLIDVPTGIEQNIGRSSFSAELNSLSPTAADSRAALADAVHKALLEKDAIVVVLSDQPIDVQSDRLIQIAPDHPPSNIGIALLSLRTDPTPQAMVRVVSNEPSFNATLTVTGASPISIASAGDYFIDLPTVPELLTATLSSSSDIDAVAQAFAAREPAWPKLLPGDSLPPELKRLIDAYTKNRPQCPDSPAVAILPLGETDQRAALAMTESTPTASLPTAKVEIANNPLAQGVDWSAAIRDGQFAQSQPPSGFTRLVWSGNRTLVAMRTQPNRQLWVGFRSTSWPTTPQFVVFWTSALDWLGQSESRYTTAVAGAPGIPLWPGVYKNLAVNAAPVPTEFASSKDWQTSLAALSTDGTSSMFDYGSWLLVAALGCLLLAGLLRG